MPCSSAAKDKESQARTQLQKMALAAARHEREAAELRIQDDARRLGCLTIMRAGPIGELKTLTKDAGVHGAQVTLIRTA